MSDVFDEASRIEEFARQSALAQQLRRSGLTGKTIADSAWNCVQCDEPIPQKRRQAMPGCQRCLSCQVLIELNEKER